MARTHVESTSGNRSLSATIMRMMAHGEDMRIERFRANSPLPHDAQRIIDKRVIGVGLQRLTIVADLLEMGLTFPLDDPLSITMVEWERTGKVGGAIRTMSPKARGEYQRENFDYLRIPVFLTHDDFSLDIRTLKMSQRVGMPLDTSGIAQATRRVNEALEEAAWFGPGTVFGGMTTYGILNAPSRNKYVIPISWTTATGDQIRADLIAMMSKLQTAKKWGPYVVYYGTAISLALTRDYKANGNDSILKRLRDIEGISKFQFADYLPADTVVMIQMTDDVIDVIDGQRPTVIPWQDAPGFEFFWMVLAIQIVRVKDDIEGNSGICVAQLAGGTYVI